MAVVRKGEALPLSLLALTAKPIGVGDAIAAAAVSVVRVSLVKVAVGDWRSQGRQGGFLEVAGSLPAKATQCQCQLTEH